MKDRIGRPLYFAGVKTGKNYVSYHVMPLYMKPDLLKVVPPALKKRNLLPSICQLRLTALNVLAS